MSNNIENSMAISIAAQIEKLKNDFIELDKQLKNIDSRNKLYASTKGYVNPYTNNISGDVLSNDKLQALINKHNNLLLQNIDPKTVMTTNELSLLDSLLSSSTYKNQRSYYPSRLISSTVNGSQTNIPSGTSTRIPPPPDETGTSIRIPPPPPDEIRTSIRIPPPPPPPPDEIRTSTSIPRPPPPPDEIRTSIRVPPPPLDRPISVKLQPDNIDPIIKITAESDLPTTISAIVNCASDDLGIGLYSTAETGASTDKITFMSNEDPNVVFAYVVQFYFDTVGHGHGPTNIRPCIEHTCELKIAQKIKDDIKNIHVSTPAYIDKCDDIDSINKLKQLLTSSSMDYEKKRKILDKLNKPTVSPCFVYTINEYASGGNFNDLFPADIMTVPTKFPVIQFGPKHIPLQSSDMMHILFQLIWQLYNLSMNCIVHLDTNCGNMMVFKDVVYDETINQYYEYTIFNKTIKIPVKNYIVKFIDFDFDEIAQDVNGNPNDIKCAKAKVMKEVDRSGVYILPPDINSAKLAALVKSYNAFVLFGKTERYSVCEYLNKMFHIAKRETDINKRNIIVELESKIMNPTGSAPRPNAMLIEPLMRDIMDLFERYTALSSSPRTSIIIPPPPRTSIIIPPPLINTLLSVKLQPTNVDPIIKTTSKIPLNITTVINCAANDLGIGLYSIAKSGESIDKLTFLDNRDPSKNFAYVVQFYFDTTSRGGHAKSIPCIEYPCELKIAQKIKNDIKNIHVGAPLVIDKCDNIDSINKLKQLLTNSSISEDKKRRIMDKLNDIGISSCFVYTINEFASGGDFIRLFPRDIMTIPTKFPTIYFGSKRTILQSADMIHILFQLIWQLYNLSMNCIAHLDTNCGNIMIYKDLNYDETIKQYYEYTIFNKTIKIPVKNYIVKFTDFDFDKIVQDIHGNPTDINCTKPKIMNVNPPPPDINSAKIIALVSSYNSFVRLGKTELLSACAYLTKMFDVAKREIDINKRNIINELESKIMNPTGTSPNPTQMSIEPLMQDIMDSFERYTALSLPLIGGSISSYKYIKRNMF